MNLLVFNLKTDADDDVLGFTTDWLNGLAKHCKKVIVITMSSGRIDVAKNVQVYSVGKERGYSELRRVIEFYKLLSGLLATERIDVCFAHMMPLFAVMGWPLLHLRRIPIVLWYAHAHVSWMLRVAAPLVNLVVTSSRGGFKLPIKKVRVIGQGISMARFHGASEVMPKGSQFILLTVGRISPVKRLELLIQLLPLLPQRLSDGRLVIARFVGNPMTPSDHVYSDSLRRLAGELGVAERIEFLPACPFEQINEQYRKADLFVNSSDHDSIDKTVLEAMSCGLPVVTSIAAFSEIFDANHRVICHVPKGGASELAGSVRKLMDMPEQERRELGLALRESVKRAHSLDALCEKLMNQFQSLKDK